MNLITLPTTTTYVWTLKNPSVKLDPEKILGDFSDIVEIHKNWKDLLSCKIKEWGIEALTLYTTDGLATTESLIQKLQADVNVLFKEVLVSSVRQVPLTEPLLMDEEFTWEKRELQDYCATYQHMPLTPWSKPLSETVVKSHGFALAILKWASELPFQPSAADSQSAPLSFVSPIAQELPSVVPINPKTGGVDFVVANDLLSLYIKAGERAREELCSFHQCEGIKKATAEAKASKEEVEEFVRLAVERAKRRAERNKAEVLGCIDDMKKSHASTVDIMKSRIEDAQREARNTFEKLTYAEQKCALQAARIDALSAAYAAKCQEVANMQNRGNGGGCTLF